MVYWVQIFKIKKLNNGCQLEMRKWSSVRPRLLLLARVLRVFNCLLELLAHHRHRALELRALAANGRGLVHARRLLARQLDRQVLAAGPCNRCFFFQLNFNL